MKTFDSMIVKACFFIALAIGSFTLIAQAPSGYYNAANGLTGNSLKSALHNIIDDHHEYVYDDLWDLLKVTDRDPNNSSNVLGIYSRFSMNAAAEYDNAAGWNREHVWAKSRGDFGESKGAGTDLHHIRACDVSTNSARNNRSFDDGGNTYVDGSGNYQGTTPAKIGSSYTWFPGNEVKGDVARMIFYMAVRYEGGSGEPDLELTDNILSQSDNSPLHGRLSALLEWHEQDPVSSAERNRNDLVYGYQNNRNPFIDHPEYVEEIWGSGSNGGGSADNGSVLISEYVEGSSYNKAIEIANLSSSSINLSSYSLKRQVNGAGSWTSGYTLSGSLPSGQVYVVCHSSASSSLSNIADAETSNDALNFNGNDPVGLFENNVLIDIIGTYNSSSNFGDNVTIRRKSFISEGSTSYSSSDWDTYSQNNFENIGSLTSTGGRISTTAKNETLNELSAFVYPNPISDQLNIKLSNEKPLLVEIISLNGQVILSKMIYPIHKVATTEISVSHLTNGVYTLVINGITKRKLIIEK